MSYKVNVNALRNDADGRILAFIQQVGGSAMAYLVNQNKLEWAKNVL